MGFTSFVGRVLFVSVFIVSAWQEPTQATEILRQALQLYKDYNSTHNGEDAPTDSSSTFLPPSNNFWVLPPTGHVKINVDGSCLDGRVAAGIIVRDHNGKFIGGASSTDGYGTPLEAEAKAFTMALNMIQQLSLTNVIIESDSKIIIDCINNLSMDCDWRIRSTIAACRSLLNIRRDIEFTFSPRTTNEAAHAIASYAITFEVNDVWFHEFGVDGGPAAKALSPKFNHFTKHVTLHTGLVVPDIEIKHLVAAAIALKGIGGILFVFGSSFGAYLLLLHLAFSTPILFDFYNYDIEKHEFLQLFIKFTQNVALFGALLYFLGMKNIVPRRQLKKKVPKTKTG